MDAYLGIDPGNNGGIAIISERGLEFTLSMPSVLGKQENTGVLDIFISLRNVLMSKNLRVGICAIETTNNAYLGSKKSLLSQGRNIGVLQGVALSFGWKVSLVEGKEWGKSLPAIAKNKDYALKRKWRKERNCAIVLERYGFQTSHDGIADAILIAHYSKETNEKSCVNAGKLCARRERKNPKSKTRK